MRRILLIRILLVGIICLCFVGAFAQETAAERLVRIENRLKALSVMVPGLNQKVQLSMSGASAQEFLRALAQANNLNINIDPQVNFKVYYNFTNETALNVLLFAAKEYELDINLIGSIMTISKVATVKAAIPKKDIKVSYNAQADLLGFDLSNDTLSNVAKKISQLTQKNVVVPVNLLSKMVSAFIAAAPFETALDKMAYANGLKLNKTSDNVFIFQALGEGEEHYITGDNATAVRKVNKPSATGQGSNANVSGSTGAKGEKLISIDALNTPIIDLIRSATAEAGVNFFIYSDINGGKLIKMNFSVIIHNFTSKVTSNTL